VFELDKDEFNAMLEFFKDIDVESKSFKIDISGCEFIYILNSSSDE
jgi:hypothetical protein